MSDARSDAATPGTLTVHRARFTRLLLCAATLIAAVPVPALAQGGGAQTCSVTTSDVVFPSYDVFATADTTTAGAVRFQCTKSQQTPVSITLTSGSLLAGSRFMSGVGTSDRLSYNLFRDAAYSLVWGDGTGGTSVFAVTNRSTSQVSVPIYGRIPKNQDVSVGTYADTITATLNY